MINKLIKLGVGIPDDVSIVGCDNIPIANEFIPSLTTYALDIGLLITEVYTAVNEMVKSGEYNAKQIFLPAKYVERDSIRAM